MWYQHRNGLPVKQYNYWSSWWTLDDHHNYYGRSRWWRINDHDGD
jgi:hypothetical protein